jgi:hypothetical protein
VKNKGFVDNTGLAWKAIVNDTDRIYGLTGTLFELEKFHFEGIGEPSQLSFTMSELHNTTAHKN